MTEELPVSIEPAPASEGVRELAVKLSAELFGTAPCGSDSPDRRWADVLILFALERASRRS